MGFDFGQIPLPLNVSLKNFFVFHSISMKLGEVLIHIDKPIFIEFK